MPPKANKRAVSAVNSSSESSEPSASDDGETEAYHIRVQYDEYKKALRIAKDLKNQRDSPVLMNFARAAWQESFSRSVDSIYSMYKRAIQQNAEDPVARRGRPLKKPNALQVHTFAMVAASNAHNGKGLLKPSSLATFDKHSAEQKNDPRAHTLHGPRLNELVEEVKRLEPWLTTTKAINTSADRMDGTAANIMDAYYRSIDDLHDQYTVLDDEPSRTMNFDELQINGRGEYAEEDQKVFTTIKLIKLLKGKSPQRCVALNDGKGNLTKIPFILGGNILLATAFIGAGPVRDDWSAPAKWTQRAAVGMPYLPGMRFDHFTGAHTRVFATESGSNCAELLEHMLVKWCVSLMRGFFFYLR
jgi:hypothetical protein